MTVFVDTSVLYALLDSDDPSHDPSREEFAQLKDTPLLTHSYVVVETVALVERRLGSEAARDLLDGLVAQLHVVFVDESVHSASTAAYLGAGARGPSLVDCTSFEVMRRHGIRTALAVDRDFADAGFDVIPA